MTREIKFRGLRTDGKGWVYGDLIHTPENKCRIIGFDAFYSDGISDYKEFNHIVLPETVGQFTGLKDKNGADIYEGDKFKPTNEEVMSVVRWDGDCLKYVVDSYGYNYYIGEGGQEVYDNEISICDTIDVGDISSEYLEIIGNIHDRQDADRKESDNV